MLAAIKLIDVLRPSMPEYKFKVGQLIKRRAGIAFASKNSREYYAGVFLILEVGVPPAHSNWLLGLRANGEIRKFFLTAGEADMFEVVCAQ